MVTTTLGITAALTLAGTGVLAQQVGGGFGVGVGGARRVTIAVPGEWSQQFQQAGTIGVYAGRGGAVTVRLGPAGPAVTGRPVSATEERKSVQTLGDGTEISTSDSNLFYRDGQGRTRVERTVAGSTAISITDPVARVSVTLNPATRTARKLSMGGGADQENGAGYTTASKEDPNRSPAPAVKGSRGGRGSAENTTYEDLGVQLVNGVLATGTRHILTIPQGQIGNNRDIHVMNERWYSEDLQMLVKTVNSDPRFGESTYELTNIMRAEPDPALFQIPPDYTTLDAGRRQAPPSPAINK